MLLSRDKIIRIDPDEHTVLLRLIRARNTPIAMFRRASAILLLWKGCGPSQVAREVGLDRANVFRWLRRFQNEGLRGLSDLPRHRRKYPSVGVATPVSEPLTPAVEASNSATMQEIAE